MTKSIIYLIICAGIVGLIVLAGFMSHEKVEAHSEPLLGKKVDNIKIGKKTLNRANYKAKKRRLKDKVSAKEKLTFTELAEWKDTLINQLKECRPSYKGTGKIDIQVLNSFLEQDC
tara:strand:+ start:7346 stop:7693 length:348 start_codon:yes stop_codon:yes gene_type:complete